MIGQISSWKARSRAALVHFGGSTLIAVVTAALVLLIWFPFPYREVSGGTELFVLVVAVDIVLGPLLTFVVFNLAKPRSELVRDLGVIVAVQMLALAYGLWTVHNARPIYLVHEVDRFKVVTLAEIDPAELPQALPEFRKLPLYGVQTIGVRKSRNSDEMFSAVDSALAGKDVSAMPGRWQRLDDGNRDEIRKRAKDVAFLRARAKDGGKELDAAIKKAGLEPTEVITLPLMSHRDDWSVLMDRRDLHIIGYVPIDGF
jgi:hypothetical protein